jgi:sialate O-acetylesterase
MTIRRTISLQLVAAMVAVLASAAHADVTPNSLFTDNAVLQRGKEIPVWGTARGGETVTVEFAGQKVSTVAKDGKWLVRLKPMQASAAPHTLTIRSDNTVTLTNIVVGDVWVASGQSNMERQLGPRVGQQPIENWEAEVAAANHPMIREYYVPEHMAYAPLADAGGQWRVCSPQTVADFSAVGYFFARDVHAAENIPIGVLFSAWGGTAAEAWTSGEALKTMPDFKSDLDMLQQTTSDPESAQVKYRRELARWYADNDKTAADWSSKDIATEGWKTMRLPTAWESAGLPDYDGIVWFRKEIQLPAAWLNKAAVLHLGPIDDQDTTWVNGVEVGATEGWDVLREYKIPAEILQEGRNVIAVRALDTGAPGGFIGNAADMRLEATDGLQVSLAGEWSYRETVPMAQASPMPQSIANNPNAPTVLYNAMLAPLQQFPITGVIWYQGEANNDRARQYQTLFPLMVSDWRRAWGCGDFPFLFVQIAPHRDMKPEIREAQLLTLACSPNTAMAVTVDIGDPIDIHPTRKAPVGARLALAARALAYGEKLEYSGPLFDKVEFKDGKAAVSFTHVGDGLASHDGELRGFTIAGADKKFVPAHAEIQGDTVVVWSEQVATPIAVRYGWANVPDVSLFNKDDLPASPFRTAVD